MKAPKSVEAQLIGLSSYANEEGDNPILFVRLDDGTVRQITAPRSDARSCQVGGHVKLLKRGSLLTLQPGGCLQG